MSEILSFSPLKKEKTEKIEELLNEESKIRIGIKEIEKKSKGTLSAQPESIKRIAEIEQQIRNIRMN